MSTPIKKAQQEINQQNRKTANERGFLPEEDNSTRKARINIMPDYSTFLATKAGRIMKQGIHHKHAPLLDFKLLPGYFMFVRKNADDTETLIWKHLDSDTSQPIQSNNFFSAQVSDPKRTLCGDFLGYPIFDQRMSSLPLFKKDILSTNLNVSGNVFRFYILARITGNIARIRFDINMAEYFKTESTLDNHIIKMFALFLKGAYFGLPPMFGHRKDTNWKERVDVGYAHLLKLIEEEPIFNLESIPIQEKPSFNYNKKMTQEIQDLKKVLKELHEKSNSTDSKTVSEIYAEKVKHLTTLLRIMKAHYAQGRRQEFLTVIMMSQRQEDWNLETDAMQYYIRVLEGIARYMYQWHEDHEDFGNYILQMMDIIHACKKSGGEELKNALGNYFIEHSRFKRLKHSRDHEIAFCFHRPKNNTKIESKTEKKVESKRR